LKFVLLVRCSYWLNEQKRSLKTTWLKTVTLKSPVQKQNIFSNVFSYQHWNGEQAEKTVIQFSVNNDGEHEICIFAKFTKSIFQLLNMVPSCLIPLIRATLYSSVSCCCVPLSSIFGTIDHRNFSIMPWIFAKCDQSKCPRCTTRDPKMWNNFEHFRFEMFSDSNSYEKEHYFHTLLHLTHVLPLSANKALLDIILIPLLNKFKDQLNKENDKGKKSP